MRHHELSDLARDETALRDRLQASISGADRGTGRAKKRLERAIFEPHTKGDKNPGRLKVAEATVAQTAASVEQGEAALAQLERDRDVLAGARDGAPRRRGSSPSAGHAREGAPGGAPRSPNGRRRERYERYREAVEVPPSSTSSPRPTHRRTRCRSSAPASSACACWTPVPAS